MVFFKSGTVDFPSLTNSAHLLKKTWLIERPIIEIGI